MKTIIVCKDGVNIRVTVPEHLIFDFESGKLADIVGKYVNNVEERDRYVLTHLSALEIQYLMSFSSSDVFFGDACAVVTRSKKEKKIITIGDKTFELLRVRMRKKNQMTQIARKYFAVKKEENYLTALGLEILIPAFEGLSGNENLVVKKMEEDDFKRMCGKARYYSTK